VKSNVQSVAIRAIRDYIIIFSDPRSTFSNPRAIFWRTLPFPVIKSVALIQEEGSSQLVSKEKGFIQRVANLSSYMPAQGGNVIIYVGSLKKDSTENCES
jgi:hypothetical protein